MYYKDLKLSILMFKYRYLICTKPVGKDINIGQEN